MSDVPFISETIGNQQSPRLLITAGVHGDEFEPMIAVGTLIDRLKPGRIRGTVTLVPVVNTAAFARGDRVAEDGLDLARVCPGDASGSITHRTAHSLSKLIRECDYYVDLHTGGRALTLLPLAGYLLHRDSAVLDKQRRMAHAFNLPLVWGTSPVLEGRSLSVARDAGVPAIYVEHGGGAEFNSSAVTDLVEGCLNVMAQLEMIDRVVAPIPRVKDVVEDPRDQSGHLQVNYPSPLDGVFAPSVAIGARIERGKPLGRVCNPVTTQSATITAEESGLVVMLRASARVRVSDALATIVAAAVPHEGKPNAR